MSDNICNFCNKPFSSFSNLSHHQKTAKYCLDIQKKDLEVQFECEYCNKNFSKKGNLLHHLKTCKNKQSKEQDTKTETINKLQLKLEKLNKVIDTHRHEIYNHLNTINELKLFKTLYEEEKLKNQKLEEDIKSLAEKAIEKSNITQVHNATTNNIVNTKTKMFESLEPLTLKAIEEQAKCIKVDSVKNHAVSLAEFFYQNVLRGKVILNDASRNIFSYKDEYGKISRDEGGIKISNMIISASRDQIYTCCVEYLKFLDSTPRILRNDKYYDLCNNLQKIGKICINKNNPNNSEYFEAFKKTFMNHLKDLVGFGDEEPKAITNEINIKNNFLVENKEKLFDLLTRYSEFLDIKAEEQGDYKDDESYLTAVLEGLDHLIKNENVRDLYNTKQFMMNFYRGVNNMKIYKDDIIQKGLLTEEEIDYITKF